MRQFNILSALWRAPLFSRAFYTDVALHWRGIGALYLLLLCFLIWIPALIQVTTGVTNFLDNEAPKALKDFPTIKIEKGIASSPVDQPYIMKDDKGSPIFVLDTTGQITNPTDAGARLLLTKTELVQVDASGKMQRNPLSAFPDTVIDSAFLLGWGHTIRNLILPVLLPFMGVFSFVIHLIMVLIFAAIGLAFNTGFGGKLSYAALLRLTAVSMTGPLLLSTLVSTFFSPGCGAWLLFHALILAYLAFGVKAAADATRPLTAFPVEMNPTPSLQSRPTHLPLPGEPPEPPEHSQFP